MKRALLCLAVLLGLPCARAGAYVDHMSGFTLGYVIEHSPTVVLEVEKVSLEKRAIVFRKGNRSPDSGAQLWACPIPLMAAGLW